MDVCSRHEPSRAAGAPGAANISAPGMMLLATAILYPCVLAGLCLGAGLLVEKVSGAPLAMALLMSVGVAALIAVTQLTTLVSAIAPASPYVVLAVALAGVAVAPARLAAIFHRARAAPLLPATQVAVYAIAMAPVLVAGRASFSSFMALSDSAVHMMGADYLIHHGQSYAHLDLANSYGRFINAYYGTSYPSGADTLFGASALLLRLPLIWAFQPFNAFVLATACGPAWLLARRLGLRGPWRALAAMTTVLPALVYGYELLGSVKEITALSMLLASGAVVASPGSWLRQGPRGAIPLALLLAAGISALGAAYGVWALAALVVLAAALPAELRSRRVQPRAVLLLALVGVITGLVAALPTWRGLGGSIQIAGNIASTSNPGNLHSALRAVQVLGVWLNGSYKLEPTGTSGVITDALLVLAGVAAVLGIVQLLRRRQWGLAGWIAMTLLAWLVVSRAVTTWASAKTLMLTSPEVLLLAWGGVALLKGRSRAMLAAGGVALALALTAGVLVSDEMQYRSSDLAPTARYQELAKVNTRFAGKGPALVTDFDEYPLYVLRDLDIGGPNFVYPPPALASAAGGYGDPVDLERIPPRALLAYPLIVTRRDPTSTRPPAAYAVAWRGSYYVVWRRRHGAGAAIVHEGLAGPAPVQCRALTALAGRPGTAEDTVAVAQAPEIVHVPLAHAKRPGRWGRERKGFVMSVAGTLSAPIRVPASGRWDVWLQGQFMPTVTVAVDGHGIGSLSGELSGNSLVPGTVPPLAATLAAGTHELSITRSAPDFAPGSRGAAVLDAVVLTPAGADPTGTLRRVPAARAQELCGGRYEWVELLPPAVS